MQTFRKKERLCNFSSINTLFAEGHSFFIHPLKIVWMETPGEGDSPAQLLISVPKRNFKRAVDRNLIKRQIRESFRHHKEELYVFLGAENRKCSLAIVFAAKGKVSFAELDAKLLSALQRLVKELKNSDMNVKQGLGSKE
jgi:ribonuclease P protein component